MRKWFIMLIALLITTEMFADFSRDNENIKEDTETLNITAMPDLTLDVSKYPLGVKYDGTDFFTCKTFTIQKALHVRKQIQHKGTKSGEENKVA